MAASYKTEQIRNIAIVGHAGSGKTTLIEALLQKAGAIRSAGSVEKGTTVCDFTDQEKRLHHTLDAAVCHLENDGRHINLLDTPGYPDFMGRALGVLPIHVTQGDDVLPQAAHRPHQSATLSADADPREVQFLARRSLPKPAQHVPRDNLKTHN